MLPGSVCLSFDVAGERTLCKSRANLDSVRIEVCLPRARQPEVVPGQSLGAKLKELWPYCSHHREAVLRPERQQRYFRGESLRTMWDDKCMASRLQARWLPRWQPCSLWLRLRTTTTTLKTWPDQHKLLCFRPCMCAERGQWWCMFSSRCFN